MHNPILGCCWTLRTLQVCLMIKCTLHTNPNLSCWLSPNPAGALNVPYYLQAILIIKISGLLIYNNFDDFTFLLRNSNPRSIDSGALPMTTSTQRKFNCWMSNLYLEEFPSLKGLVYWMHHLSTIMVQLRHPTWYDRRQISMTVKVLGADLF